MDTNTQVQDFIDRISGASSLYGLGSETLNSLILSLVSPMKTSYESLEDGMDSVFKKPSVMDNSGDLQVLLMEELLQSLYHSAGFHILPVSTTRLKAFFSSG